MFSDMSQIIKIVYLHTFALSTIEKGFSATGIWPLNSQIFTDKYFVPAENVDVFDGLSNLMTNIYFSIELISDNVDKTQLSTSNNKHGDTDITENKDRLSDMNIDKSDEKLIFLNSTKKLYFNNNYKN